MKRAAIVTTLSPGPTSTRRLYGTTISAPSAGVSQGLESFAIESTSCLSASPRSASASVDHVSPACTR
jgi:hypothetical protein